jgi:hypothetical protein
MTKSTAFSSTQADPGIARRDDQPIAFRVLLHRPGKGMFAAAAAQDQNVHGNPLGLRFVAF